MSGLKEGVFYVHGNCTTLTAALAKMTGKERPKVSCDADINALTPHVVFCAFEVQFLRIVTIVKSLSLCQVSEAACMSLLCYVKETSILHSVPISQFNVSYNFNVLLQIHIVYFWKSVVTCHLAL